TLAVNVLEPMKVDSPKRPTKDHVRPKWQSGTLEQNNCIIVCGECNHDKDGMSVAAFLGWLRDRGDQRAAFVQAVIDQLAMDGGSPKNVPTTTRGDTEGEIPQ